MKYNLISHVQTDILLGDGRLGGKNLNLKL